MLPSRSNQLVTAPLFLPPLFNGLWVTGMNGWKFALALPLWPPMLRAQKKKGRKKRRKNATYEQIFAPASNNGTTEHPSPPPLFVDLPRFRY